MLAKSPGFTVDGDFDSGARHWSKHGVVFGSERRVAQAAAIPTTRSARLDGRKQTKFRNRFDFLSEFSRLAERQSYVYEHGPSTGYKYNLHRAG